MGKANTNSLSGKTREQAIKSCTKCGGNPPIGKTNLQGIDVTFCDRADCMEVINYSSLGAKKINTQKIVENIKEEIKQELDNKISNDEIPFKLTFNSKK